MFCCCCKETVFLCSSPLLAVFSKEVNASNCFSQHKPRWMPCQSLRISSWQRFGTLRRELEIPRLAHGCYVNQWTFPFEQKNMYIYTFADAVMVATSVYIYISIIIHPYTQNASVIEIHQEATPFPRLKFKGCLSAEKVCSSLGCPPAQDSSHHQDYYMFSRGSRTKSSSATVTGRGEQPNL